MNNPKLSIVSAISENRVIGKENKIPWHIKEDLIHLKNLILNHTVILGRKTFESLLYYYDKSGRLLPAKNYLVITSDENYKITRVNCYRVNSLDEAIFKAKELENDEIFIIGGAQVYSQAISLVDKLYLTVVHLHVDGDAFFPDYSEFAKEVSRTDKEAEGIKYTFLELER